MRDVAITVESLSKRYRIGLKEEMHDTFAGALADFATRPVRSFRRLRRLSSFEENGQGRADVIWALRDVSFEIRRGEVLGIIGPNGAGKSTLLKVISRITEPTSGRVYVNGRVSSLLEVGTGFHPELTGRENVYLNGTVLGMRRGEVGRKFDEIVEFSGVEQFIDTPVKRYSSGMQVRLAFAVAAHLEPEILVVDEVLAVGDAAFQKKCLGKMENVASEGRTVLFVSHNMLALQNLCTRAVLLTSGKIAAEGDTEAVITRYLGARGEVAEVSWDTPDGAPGDERARLKAVRVVSRGEVTGEVEYSSEFRVEVDYWNFEPNGRRLISVHVFDAKGTLVLTSGNVPSASRSPDPWYGRAYPSGVFRTTCTFPAYLLNEGVHNLSVYLNSGFVKDTIAHLRDALSFVVKDEGIMDREFTGEWLGVVRPHLDWKTVQLN